MKFNKTIKTRMINTAITDKFEKSYEQAVKKVEVAAREWLVENSLHNSIVSKLNSEELKYVQGTSSLSFNSAIRTEFLPFINQSHKRQVNFAPVYGTDFYYLEDEKCPELAQLRELVKQAENELKELSSVVHSYTKIKDLFDALPWIKKHYPEQILTTGTMVAKDTINSLNAKFGG